MIAAGGTAGHVVPALAVADELRADGARGRLRRRRARRGRARPGAPATSCAPIRVEGLSRTQPAARRSARVRAPRRALRAAPGRSCASFARRRCSAAAATSPGRSGSRRRARGSRSSSPRRTATSGSPTGCSRRFARRVCLAFPIAGRDGERYRVTGRPVPPPATDRAAARRRFGIGRGRAARARVRRLARRALDQRGGDRGVRATPGFRVPAQRGRARPRRPARAAPAPRLRPARLTSTQFGEALAASDLVVARAGGSIFEIAAARPAGDPRALSARRRRPPDEQRPLDGARRRRRRDRRRRADGRSACAPRSTRCWPNAAARGDGAASAALARPDAARAIAARARGGRGGRVGRERRPWAGRRCTSSGSAAPA